MLTSHSLRDWIKAEPFQPFILRMASGRTYEIRHPEMIKVLKTSALVFWNSTDVDDFPDRYDTVSLMLAESIAPLEATSR